MRSALTTRIAKLLIILPFLASSLATKGAAVPLTNATATLSQPAGWDVGTAIDGRVDSSAGWAVYDFSISQAKAQTAVFETVNDIGFAGGSLFTFTLSQINHNPFHTIGRFRLSVTTDNRSTFANGVANGGDVEANWSVLTPMITTATDGAILNSLYDGSILASGINPEHSTYTITALSNFEKITGVRLEVLEDPSLPESGPGRYVNGNFVLTELMIDVTPVPEPSTIGLLSAAGILLLGRKLRKAKM